MTEAEWVNATDPMPMLKLLRGKASERKLRLLVCNYFRSLYAPADPRNTVITIGERCADGQASAAEVNRARSIVPPTGSSQSLLVVVSDKISDSAYPVISHEFVCLLPREKVPRLCQPIRDIFGNPFRPVAVDPSWRTSTVVALAEGIYAERAFDRLPILADALQDAGCDHPDMLNHCRSDGPHVRGCWVVDLVLGKQ
jgi:hypothetical protein